ncbi:hypothetical protein CBR_g37836 [Chara braunii]|uniref:Large ribosomal subunit protein uL11m n=1 Tax=Chara braunii TaxID=69332 RepID=A0A388LNT7_CHABU|nr:hypothetical protein CBR_g37836 [Chara braunii]|eukprot:GBG83964.1 hypothetical protein CBR_g37836 [Chara braunii]
MAQQQGAKRAVTTIRLIINAGQAKPAPPVGPALGQHGLNLMGFCKEFNARTQQMKPDVPVPVTVTAYADRTFDFQIRSPSPMYFLKRAAGINRCAKSPGHDAAGTVTLKHIYEIAKIKQQDPDCQYLSLKGICTSLIGTARSMGIKVVRNLDSEATN